MYTNYYYQQNTDDQRFFPLLPFLLGAAVSPYLYGYPYYGHYSPYYGPYNYGYGHYPYGYYY